MLQINFNPFPTLFTERLVLRQIVADDEQDIFLIRGNKNTMKFIPRPLAKNLDDAQELITKVRVALHKNDGINWGIALKENNKLIGMGGYHRITKEHYRAEIGYVLNSDFHRKGIITEALTEIIRFGFENLRFNSIEAVISPANFASRSVIEKCKFEKEAHFKNREFYNERFNDILIYVLHQKK